jgi:hypothetical protein
MWRKVAGERKEEKQGERDAASVSRAGNDATRSSARKSFIQKSFIH